MIRVATYNVHGFVGLDQRRDPARTAAVITELQCDAVGLQEVDSRYCSSAIDTIERHTGMRAVPGVTMSTPSGDYGNVLLSRVAVRGVRRHDLTVDNREPRGALEAELEADGGAAFRMIVTHLGLRRSERRRQTTTLLRIVDRRPSREPLVLAADLNEWWPRSKNLARIRRVLGAAAKVRSFPSSLPAVALDRLWVRPSRAVSDLRVHRTPLARRASDHLPVVATVDLTPSTVRPGE